MSRILLGLFLLLVSPPAYGKPIRIINDGGGYLFEYVARYGVYAARNQRVIVDGDCMSACTIMLGFRNRMKICATDDGIFGFHSAMVNGAYDFNATTFLRYFYPLDVIDILANNGWPDASPHPDLIRIKATEIVPHC